MKKVIVLAVTALVVSGIVFASCNSQKPYEKVKLVTEADSVSFMIGQSYGSGNKKQMEQQMDQWPVKGNLEALIAGFLLGFENSDDTLFLGKNFQAAGEFVNEFFQRAQQIVAVENKTKGDQFLVENHDKSGVKVTESGLQYSVITEGKGMKPEMEDTVLVHFTGKLLDGTIFQSTLQQGQPLKIARSQVIPGWAEGIGLMNVGSKYTLWIPSELAYGEQGNQTIPPNSVLEFELELLEIFKKK